MAIRAKITYKNDNDIFSNSFTPSYINPAINGVDGTEGKLGKSLYFTNYDLSNDYYKDIVIKKISNGMLLSSDADIKLEHRNYVDGDIIITNDKLVYNITLNDDLYGIKLIGKLQDENIVQDYKDNILSVNLDIKFDKIQTPLVSNRSLDASIDVNGIQSVDFSNADNTLYCIRIKPFINIIDSNNYNYEFYLKIKLYNSKNILGEEYSFIKGVSDNDNTANNLSETDNIITFFKNIEFPLTKKCADGYTSDTDNEYILSDMSLDKLHPSGNNIDIKLTTSGLRTQNDKTVGNIVYDNGEYILDLLDDELENAKNTTLDKVKDAVKEKLEQSHTYIQYPRELDLYGNYRYNFRGGESVYFSGMIDTKNYEFGMKHSVNNYHTAVKNIDHDKNYKYVCEHMLDFLLSPNNIYELVCVNTETNWAEIVDLKNNTNIKLNITKE